MKKILGATFIVSSLILTGCASSSKLTSEQKHSLIAEYTQQKTFEIECETGCKVSYKDPRDTLNLPRETNGWDVANTAIGATASIITTAVPYAAIGIIATEGFKASGDTVTGSYNSQSSSRTDIDRSTNLTDSLNSTTDSTHAPTVVTQPEPVVVVQGESDE